jgi:hypothetical protein
MRVIDRDKQRPAARPSDDDLAERGQNGKRRLSRAPGRRHRLRVEQRRCGTAHRVQRLALIDASGDHGREQRPGHPPGVTGVQHPAPSGQLRQTGARRAPAYGAQQLCLADSGRPLEHQQRASSRERARDQVVDHRQLPLPFQQVRKLKITHATIVSVTYVVKEQ